jgi:hypothetical protein
MGKRRQRKYSNAREKKRTKTVSLSGRNMEKNGLSLLTTK